MIAYKGFKRGLTCRGYQYHIGETATTVSANCARDGFHCAENPLDCLTYYPEPAKSDYAIVTVEGDIDEDDYDSKISATVMTPIKVLPFEKFLVIGLRYLFDHPRAKSSVIKRERGTAEHGYVIVRGKSPAASGRVGDLLAIIKENENGTPRFARVIRVDGVHFRAGHWYRANGKEVPRE